MIFTTLIMIRVDQLAPTLASMQGPVFLQHHIAAEDRHVERERQILFCSSSSFYRTWKPQYKTHVHALLILKVNTL